MRRAWTTGSEPGGIAAAAFLAALLAAAPPSLADMVPVDLNLDKAPTHELRVEPHPNPHDDYPCAGCHENTNLTYEMAVKYGVEIPLITEGDSSILLCEECHQEGQHSFHPVNFPVRRLFEVVSAQGIFPLETIVEGFDKLTCITCHDVHFPHTGNRLLRGFPLVPEESEVAFRDRIDFCAACHGRKEIARLSSHRDQTPDDRCNACHLGYRQPGVPGPISRNINQNCVVCHPLPSGARSHFYNYNPFPDFEREELADYGLSLEKGGFTCNVCHRHHRKENDRNLLRPGYVSIVSKSARVNPHRTTRFCLNCHPFSPAPVGTADAVAPLWEEDVTRICKGCHGKEGTLRMVHPMDAPSRPGVIPEGWELRKDGSMGCQTCHTDGHGPYDPENPKLLRGGYYSERNGICFRCHDKSAYENRNIHDEMGDPGSCEFCHVVKGRTALRPEGKVGDLQAEPVFLCLLCHESTPHPGGTDHTGLPESHSFVTIDQEVTPLSMGKVTCHTCHDSHAAEAGVNLLRVGERKSLLCGNCHPF